MIFIKFCWLLLVAFCRPGSTWEDPFALQFDGAQQFSGAQEPQKFIGAQEPSVGGSSDYKLGASFSGAQEPSVEGISNYQPGASITGAVETPRPEVQDLWPSVQDLSKPDAEKQLTRDERNALDDVLACFSQTPVKLAANKEKGERAWQQEADAWYRDLTKNAALKKRSDTKKVRSVSQERSKYVIDHPDKAMDNPKPKYKEWSNEGIIQKHEGTLRPPQAKDGGITNLDAKLKQAQRMLSEQEHLEAQERLKAKDVLKKDESMAESLPNFGDAPVPDGVYERTLNSLSFSHPRPNTPNQKVFKKSPEFSSSQFSSLGQDDIKQKKRSFSNGFNPMDEIKLKTSIRLMRKGFGPMLPSSSLDINRHRVADNKLELEDLQPPQFDSQESVNMKPYNQPENNNFEYRNFPSNDLGLNMDPMMDLPKSYDRRMPQYEPLPNVMDYERDNRMPSELDRFKREPDLGSSSLGNVEFAFLESLGESSAIKPSSQENKRKPLEGEEYLKAPELGLNTKEATALDSTKENDSKGEKSKESREYTKLDGDLLIMKPERKLESVEGKAGRKPVSEFEAKLLELDAADGIFPSKSFDNNKEVRNSAAEHDIESKSEEVAKVDNDDDLNMMKMNINLELKEPKPAAVETSATLSYPDAVVKLMAEEMFQDRSKRDSRYRQLSRQRRRAKRSLGENADSLAPGFQVYDPTKYMVPMMNQRPLALSPPQQVLQQVPLQVMQQQPPQLQQANRQALEISNFKASFNLSNLFSAIQNLPKQPVQKQPTVKLPVKQTTTPTTAKPTSAPIKSFGLHRFFGPFFGLKASTVSTIDPNCVSITTPDVNNTTTTPEPVSAAPPQDNVCDNPDSVKVNVSINANVCANLKMKQFYSNGSIILTPNKELPPPESNYKTQVGRLQGNKDSMDDRQARGVAGDTNENSANEWELKKGKNQRKTEGFRKRPSMKALEPGRKQGNAKQTFQKVTPNIHPKVAHKWTPPQDSYDRLVSGELSKEIVAAVFEAVRNDPELALLLPILERNLKEEEEPKNDYQDPQDKIENSYMHRQTCIPLRPDLQEFYDLVLKTAEEEEKVRQKTQYEGMEKRLTGVGYSPRFVKLLNTAENLN